MQSKSFWVFSIGCWLADWLAAAAAAMEYFRFRLKRFFSFFRRRLLVRIAVIPIAYVRSTLMYHIIHATPCCVYVVLHNLYFLFFRLLSHRLRQRQLAFSRNRIKLRRRRRRRRRQMRQSTENKCAFNCSMVFYYSIETAQCTTFTVRVMQMPPTRMILRKWHGIGEDVFFVFSK